MDVKFYGQRLMRLRKLAGLTQKEMANRAGIAPTLMTDYERGKLRLYDHLIVQFSEILGITADEFLGKDSTSTEDFQPTRAVMQRIRRIEKLPETKRKAIFKALDALIGE